MNRMLILLTAALALFACTQQDGPAERAGAALDEAADSVDEAVRDVRDEAEDLADEIPDNAQQ